MAGWLKRLVGATDKPVPTAAPGIAAAPAAKSNVPADAPQPPVASACRRPLVSALGGVAGFEFQLSESVQRRLRARDDPIAQAAHTIALLTSMRPTIQAERVAMAWLPNDVLTRDAVRKELAGACVVLGAPQVPPSEALSSLRQIGVRIGRVAGDTSAPSDGDFLVLRRGPEGFDPLAAQVSRVRAMRPQLPLVVTDVEGIDELERVLALDVWLACAHLQAQAVSTRAGTPRPAVAHICQVLAQLREERHASDVARQLGADVALSYRLLRCVNSPAFGLSRRVASIEEAVMLVGHAGLHRWLCIALLACADGRKTSRALQEVSLARARFLESLAGHAGRDPPQALFTVGLLSLLDALLQAPLAEALAPLHLGEIAVQALLERRGPWFEYLALAQDLESNRLAEAAVRAERFGGLDVVLRQSADAWQWAAGVTQALDA
jgi:c-di-GMP phosphodiesterase